MKDSSIVQERLTLIKREVKGLAEKTDKVESAPEDINDVRDEIKGLKIFPGSVRPTSSPRPLRYL